jgi:hypothetical protein
LRSRTTVKPFLWFLSELESIRKRSSVLEVKDILFPPVQSREDSLNPPMKIFCSSIAVSSCMSGGDKCASTSDNGEQRDHPQNGTNNQPGCAKRLQSSSHWDLQVLSPPSPTDCWRVMTLSRNCALFLTTAFCNGPADKSVICCWFVLFSVLLPCEASL